jgi:hypothetical protein
MHRPPHRQQRDPTSYMGKEGVDGSSPSEGSGGNACKSDCLIVQSVNGCHTRALAATTWRSLGRRTRALDSACSSGFDPPEPLRTAQITAAARVEALGATPPLIEPWPARPWRGVSSRCSVAESAFLSGSPPTG